MHSESSPTLLLENQTHAQGVGDPPVTWSTLESLEVFQMGEISTFYIIAHQDSVRCSAPKKKNLSVTISAEVM